MQALKVQRLVICDLDGTLIDSRRALTDTVNTVRAHYNLPPLDIDTVTSYIGDGSKALIQRAFNGHDINIDDAHDLMQTAYAEHTPSEQDLYPGVRTGLKNLSDAGVHLAIVTNKPQKATENLLDKLSLAHFFQVIIGGSPAYPLKPDPAPLTAVIRQTGISPANTWMIGDHHTDLEAGRRAEVNTCLAAYGFGTPGNEQPDMKVNSFPEFSGFICSS